MAGASFRSSKFMDRCVRPGRLGIGRSAGTKADSQSKADGFKSGTPCVVGSPARCWYRGQLKRRNGPYCRMPCPTGRKEVLQVGPNLGGAGEQTFSKLVDNIRGVGKGVAQ